VTLLGFASTATTFIVKHRACQAFRQTIQSPPISSCARRLALIVVTVADGFIARPLSRRLWEP
jgi:hypothetical protein